MNSAMNFKQNLLFDIAIKHNFVTDDPFVNHMVDCHLDDAFIPFELELENRAIKAQRDSGGIIISLNLENWEG